MIAVLTRLGLLEGLKLRFDFADPETWRGWRKDTS